MIMSKKYKKFKEISNYAPKVFDYAIPLGIIEKNPFEHVTYPKIIKETREPIILSTDKLIRQLNL